MVRDPNGDPVSLQPVNVEKENGDGETRNVKSCCKLLSIQWHPSRVFEKQLATGPLQWHLLMHDQP